MQDEGPAVPAGEQQRSSTVVAVVSFGRVLYIFSDSFLSQRPISSNSHKASLKQFLPFVCSSCKFCIEFMAELCITYLADRAYKYESVCRDINPGCLLGLYSNNAIGKSRNASYTYKKNTISSDFSLLFTCFLR